jgi:excisionase family DNA binding protein
MIIATHFSIPETAEKLRVTIPTIRVWIAQNRLPVIRIGRRVFIKSETIAEILRNGFSTKGDKNKIHN